MGLISHEFIPVFKSCAGLAFAQAAVFYKIFF